METIPVGEVLIQLLGKMASGFVGKRCVLDHEDIDTIFTKRIDHRIEFFNGFLLDLFRCQPGIGLKKIIDRRFIIESKMKPDESSIW
jgi:hypothetical protein